MSTIDSYHFGQIVIDGKKYSSDVIIFPDRVQANWHRSKGHELSLEDITGVVAEKPEVLIIGTGASGLLRVPPEVSSQVAAQNIKLMVAPTGEACDLYNRLSCEQKVAAVFHLTC